MRKSSLEKIVWLVESFIASKQLKWVLKQSLLALNLGAHQGHDQRIYKNATIDNYECTDTSYQVKYNWFYLYWPCPKLYFR